MGVITDEARTWAEREYPTFEYLVTSTDIARFARATGETNPIHYDKATANAAGYVDMVAPTMFPYLIRMHASTLVSEDELDPDGSPTAEVPPLSTRRAMAGETSIEIGVPVVVGDRITVTKSLADMYEKVGRTGALVFVQMEYLFVNQRDERVFRELFTRIYR